MLPWAWLRTWPPSAWPPRHSAGPHVPPRRNLAATAGATGELLEKIVKQMVSEKNVRLEYAQELVKQYQK